MENSIYPVVLTVVTAHFLALLSPGPDFILIVKSGVLNSKRNALGVPLGIASANGVYIFLCIIGVGELLMKSLILLKILKALGGIFLLYIAFSALKAKKEDYQNMVSNDKLSVKESPLIKEFMTGFISGISNPKNLVFYLSLFSVVLTGETGNVLKIGLGVWMTALVFLWDSFILIVLTREKFRKPFSESVYYIDKLTGSVLGILGLRLFLSAWKDREI